MYICICICIYECVYIYIYVYVYVYVCVCICIYIYIYVLQYIDHSNSMICVIIKYTVYYQNSMFDSSMLRHGVPAPRGPHAGGLIPTSD